MSPARTRPPLPEETFTHGFGEGEGELVTLIYPKPLPMRLDRWLVSQRSEQSRARIQKFIDAGYVRVNGKTGKAKTPCGRAMRCSLDAAPGATPHLKPEPMELDVLFEDEHLIVINKPAGLTVHPAPGNKDGTLVNGLLHHCPDLPGISGWCARASSIASTRTPVASSSPNPRRPWCGCRCRSSRLPPGSTSPSSMGCPTATAARRGCDRSASRRSQETAVVSGENGRYACTHWTLLERLGDYSLLRFKLDTGRTHQIRVHCAHMNHPVVGDPTYSRCRKLPIELPGQALHAFQLGLDHPITRERMLFEAPLPPVMEKLLDVLRRRSA